MKTKMGEAAKIEQVISWEYRLQSTTGIPGQPLAAESTRFRVETTPREIATNISGGPTLIDERARSLTDGI
jgi:hypothetical protein